MYDGVLPLRKKWTSKQILYCILTSKGNLCNSMAAAEISSWSPKPVWQRRWWLVAVALWYRHVRQPGEQSCRSRVVRAQMWRWRHDQVAVKPVAVARGGRSTFVSFWGRVLSCSISSPSNWTQRSRTIDAGVSCSQRWRMTAGCVVRSLTQTTLFQFSVGCRWVVVVSHHSPGGDIGDAMLKTWSDRVRLRQYCCWYCTLACRPRSNDGLVGGRQNAVNFFRVGNEYLWNQRWPLWHSTAYIDDVWYGFIDVDFFSSLWDIGAEPTPF